MSSQAVPVAGVVVAARPRSQVLLVLRELSRNRGAIVGAVMLLALLGVALAAPLLATHDPIRVAPRDSLAPPSARHWLGADKFGRDVYSRIIYGTRISLLVGLISVGIGVSLGVPLGLLAGWSGGWTSYLIMRFTDAMLAMPGLLLALTIIAALGPSLENAMVAVGISSVPTYVRLVFGSVLSTRELTFVEAARVAGCPTPRILARHILPNVAASVIVVASLGMGTAILSAAGLSFLGLGAQPPTPEWGASVSDGRDLLDSAWWVSTFPSLAIMLAVLAINLLGDGLRDALDPRLRRR